MPKTSQQKREEAKIRSTRHLDEKLLRDATFAITQIKAIRCAKTDAAMREECGELISYLYDTWRSMDAIVDLDLIDRSNYEGAITSIFLNGNENDAVFGYPTKWLKQAFEKKKIGHKEFNQMLIDETKSIKKFYSLFT